MTYLPGSGGTFKSGDYYAADFFPSDTTGAATQNLLFFSLFSVGATALFDRIGLEVTAAAASSTVRLGIYSDLGRKPSNLLLDAGTIDSATTGAKELTISKVLFPGLYWLAAAGQGAGGAVVRSRSNVLLTLAQGSINNANVTCFTQAGVTAALPAAATPAAQQTAAPKVMLRAA